jgi:hypothetical protein
MDFKLILQFSYLERAVLDGACSNEGYNHGDHIHSELELQEFGDAVVHVAAPHDRLHDAAEVVVGQDDVGSLFGHVSSGNSLKRRTIISIYHLDF